MVNGTPVVAIGDEGVALAALAAATNQVRQAGPDGIVAIDAWVQDAVDPKRSRGDGRRQRDGGGDPPQRRAAAPAVADINVRLS